MWEGSLGAVGVYEDYEADGSTKEACRQRLVGLWDYVWHHGLDDDLNAAVELLKQRGVFRYVPCRL